MNRKPLQWIFHNTCGLLFARIKDNYYSRVLRSKKVRQKFLLPTPFYKSQIHNDKYWSERSCGIACVHMVLSTVLGKSFDRPISKLIDEGLSFKGYDVEKDLGWYHKALVKLSVKYGLKAKQRKFLLSSELAVELLKHNYVVASMESIHDGHLILIYGFKMNGRLDGFFYHDPYNKKQKGEAKFMKKQDFEKKFTRRVIIFSAE